MSEVSRKFGEFELNSARYELRRNGQPLKLERIPMDLLILLAEKEGNVVSRQEIIERLWGSDVFVDTEHGINTAIRKIRSALREDAERPRFVQTVQGKGYRFVAEKNGDVVAVTPAHRRTSEESPNRTPLAAAIGDSGVRQPSWQFGWLLASAALAILLGLGGWSFARRNRRALTAKDTIVLAEFTNTTDDPVFNDTLRQGTLVQLEQSPFLSIITDGQVADALHRMGLNPGTELTPDVAREVCLRTGSAAVLNGNIAQVGSQYDLSLRAVACVDGAALASTEALASDKDHVLGALGKTASEMRSKLGESRTSIQKFDLPLQQVTTSSLEALREFSVYANGRGRVPPFPVLLRVIELDPNFAAAYGQLADAYTDLGEFELASQYAQKAFDLRNRVSERERLGINSTYYYAVLGDLDQELRTYPVSERMYPRDWGFWNNSAATRLWLGDYTRAAQEASQALQLEPDALNPYINLGSALLFLNRRDEVKKIANQALARGFDSSAIHLLLYDVAFLENDVREMDAQLSPLLEKPEALNAQVTQSMTEAYSGRLKRFLVISEQAFQIASKGNNKELAAQIRDAEALRQAEFGNLAAASRTAATALSISSGRNAKIFTALALARARETSRAQALANELRVQLPSHTLLQRYWLPTIQASIELARNNPSKALDILQTVSYEYGNADFPVGNLYSVYVRGQAYLATGQAKAAAAEFQRLLDHRSIVLNSPLVPLACLNLARAYSLQGDAEKARVSYRDFLSWWKNADPDIPIMKQAKAEYVRLQ